LDVFMKKVIIVGGAGFVGSAVTREMLQNDVEATVVVRPGFIRNRTDSRLNGLDIRLVECDITNITELPNKIDKRGFDAYYQFAWEGLFNEPLLDYTTQIMNIKWVMDAIVTASELECKKFIGAGSISQYELSIDQGKTNKNDKHKVYKTAKLACEYMGRSVAFDHGIEFFWPIITNIYGEGEYSPRLINTLIRKLLAGEHPSLSDGNQIYDFIHISDAARAFYLIGEKGKEFQSYVLASGNARPLKEFLCILRDIVNPNGELGFGEFPFNGIYLPREAYSIAALTRDTGFEAKISFEEGVRRVSEWIKVSSGSE
jgi:nucleoside-diphosphate-sugar epimerase